MFNDPFLEAGGFGSEFSIVGDGKGGEGGCLSAFLMSVLFLGDQE